MGAGASVKRSSQEEIDRLREKELDTEVISGYRLSSLVHNPTFILGRVPENLR